MPIKITAIQVKSARAFSGLSVEKSAELVYVSGRMWRKYEAGEVQINLACWELYLIKTNQVLNRG